MKISRWAGLAKYHLDYNKLSQIHPNLIHCSVSGFRQDGSDANRAGYDFMIQGISGLMSVTGEPQETGGITVKVGVALIDGLTGLSAVIAILAAIEHRTKTGHGQHIDLSLFDVGV